MARRQPTEKQKKFAENIVKGIPQERSAILAGDSGTHKTTLMRSDGVQAELARIRKEAIENTGVTKESVIEMLLEAANFARITGDPMGLTAVARELGKMLGYYAPEVKKIEKNIDQASLRKALKDMNDDDLYKLAHARTINSTAERVEDVPEVPQIGTGSQVLPES